MPQLCVCDGIAKISYDILGGKNIANYGNFSLTGDEYSITKPDTPRPWRNLIYNKSYCLTIAQNGIGYSAHRELVNPITKDNQQAGRYVIIRDNDSGEFWSASWYPTTQKLEEFGSIHRPGSTEISAKHNKIETSVMFTVHPSEPCEYWSIQLTNADKHKRRLSIFTFVDWDTTQQIRSEFQDNIIIATSHDDTEKTIARFLTLDHAADSFDCDWNQFIGRYGNIALPKAVSDGKCSRSITGDNRIAALQRNITIGAGSQAKFSVILGAVTADNMAQAKRQVKKISKLLVPAGANDLQEKIPERVVVKSPDSDWNTAVNTWLKLQLLSPISSSSSTRDQLRSINLGTTHQPNETKLLLADVLKLQYRDGSVIRSKIEPIPDRTVFTTSELLTAVTEYVTESGDTNFLPEHLPFFDSGSASVLEHIVRGCGSLSDQLHSGESQSQLERSVAISAIRNIIPILTNSAEHQFVRRIERIVEHEAARTNRYFTNHTKQSLETVVSTVHSQLLTEKNLKTAMKQLRSDVKQLDTTSTTEILLSTIFSTAEAFALNNEPEHALELLERFSPAVRAKSNELYQAEPYLIPRSILTNSQQRGQASPDLDNLAAGQLWRVFVESILGIRPCLGGLKIDPHIPRSWRQYDVSREFRGATYHIRVINPLRATGGVDRLSVNGLHITGNVIRPYQAGNHFVEVTLG